MLHLGLNVNDLDLELTCPTGCREIDIHDATSESQDNEED